MRTKVFGIGFHKTGTTSLKSALQMLGYSVTGPNGVRDPDIALHAQQLADTLVPQYDAFQDNPWPVLYRYLDETYPGNKFILTTRDPETWIRSQCMHFGTRTTPMREWIYGVGCPIGNEEIYLRRYAQHHADVLEYFKDRQNDLLVMDFAKGDGWQKLCPFLECEPLDVSFPHLNKASTRQEKPAKKPSLVKQIINALGKRIR